MDQEELVDTLKEILDNVDKDGYNYEIINKKKFEKALNLLWNSIYIPD